MYFLYSSICQFDVKLSWETILYWQKFSFQWYFTDWVYCTAVSSRVQRGVSSFKIATLMRLLKLLRMAMGMLHRWCTHYPWKSFGFDKQVVWALYSEAKSWGVCGLHMLLVFWSHKSIPMRDGLFLVEAIRLWFSELSQIKTQQLRMLGFTSLASGV